MAAIKVDRHVVVRAGEPDSFGVVVGAGVVGLVATADGVRVEVHLTPDEARALGVACIEHAARAREANAAPLAPVIALPNGTRGH